MSRAIGWFAGFCVLMLLAGFAVSWWLGPRLLSLAFDFDRSTQPFYALYLRHRHQANGQLNHAYPAQWQQLLNQTESDPGLPQGQSPARRLWHASSVSVLVGSVADEWGHMELQQFTSTRQFVRLATSPDYRELRARTPRQARALVASFEPMTRPLTHQAALLLLADSQDRGAIDPWLELQLAAGGELLWDTTVIRLEDHAGSDSDWNLLVLVGFADAQQLDQWVLSLDAQTANALLQANVNKSNQWLLRELDGVN